MGYLNTDHKFVSEVDIAGLAEARKRAVWLAERWFAYDEMSSIDLGEVPTYGYVHAIIEPCYAPSETRIRFMTEGSYTLFTARYRMEKGTFLLLSQANWVGRLDRHRGAVYVGFRDVRQFAEQYFTYLKRGEAGHMWGNLQARKDSEAARGYVKEFA